VDGDNRDHNEKRRNGDEQSGDTCEPAVRAAALAAPFVLRCSAPPVNSVPSVPSVPVSSVDGRRTTGGIHARTRSVLVVLQIALSVVLLVSAALMTRSFLALQRVDPGFRSDHLLSFRIAWPGATLDPQNRFRSRDAFNEFGRRLQAELAAQPGVTGVGGVSHLPYDNLPNWGGPYITKLGEDDSVAPMADNRA
jgi:hypothetical protein